MSKYSKYPKTLHCPWSESVQNDDKVIDTMRHFDNKEIVVTEKMDGENTTMYCDHIHARSIDSKYHESRNWVKSFWSSISHKIPSGWRICGENLYAKHSIEYQNLKSYFYGFSVWDDENNCLAWDDMLEVFNELGIICVPTLYRGIYNQNILKEISDAINKNICEGYVIRFTSNFSHKDFNKSVVKFVRRDHVQTSEHWMYSRFEINKMVIK